MSEASTGTARSAAIESFLADAGWTGAQHLPLAGDASPRRYLRLQDGSGASAVLMDARSGDAAQLRRFSAIARHLSGMGFSAPGILSEAPETGLMLLEDLGDDLFARVLSRDPTHEPALYAAATDLLAALHAQPAPDGTESYDAVTMGKLAALALDWYAAGISARDGEDATIPAPSTHDGDDRARLVETVAAQCDRLAPVGTALALRDYHAENLIWLPRRRGHARVGLLDFQDALRAHPAYDLVSLLDDARREVSAPVRQSMIRRYITATGQEAAPFTAALACLGAQRNLRILGVFARLCLRDAKPAYLHHLPRVWRCLMADLAHPALAPLAAQVARLVPAPTPERIERIASRCPSGPRP